MMLFEIALLLLLLPSDPFPVLSSLESASARAARGEGRGAYDSEANVFGTASSRYLGRPSSESISSTGTYSAGLSRRRAAARSSGGPLALVGSREGRRGTKTWLASAGSVDGRVG